MPGTCFSPSPLRPAAMQAGLFGTAWLPRAPAIVAPAPWGMRPGRLGIGRGSRVLVLSRGMCGAVGLFPGWAFLLVVPLRDLPCYGRPAGAFSCRGRAVTPASSARAGTGVASSPGMGPWPASSRGGAAACGGSGGCPGRGGGGVPGGGRRRGGGGGLARGGGGAWPGGRGGVGGGAGGAGGGWWGGGGVGGVFPAVLGALGAGGWAPAVLFPRAGGVSALAGAG